MQILRVINNNVVSCVDENGHEIVAMGRGLGFGVRAGANLDESRAEKIFRMETQSETDKLKNILRTIPQDQLELCNKIVDFAGNMLGRRLSESLYLTLTDHIAFAIERFRQGMMFHNALLTEVRLFYPQEYAVGRYALDLIRSEMNMLFPDDEAASIALHLVNAEYDNSLSEIMRITEALHDILSLLESKEGLHLVPGTLSYDELIIHIKFLALRAFSKRENPPQKDPQFDAFVRQSFPVEYACAEDVARYLSGKSSCPLSEEDKAYLALHLHRAGLDHT